MISFGELQYIQKGNIFVLEFLGLNLCYVACYGSICDYALLKLIIGLKFAPSRIAFYVVVSFCTYN